MSATWTAGECAGHWGVAESTWRDAVADGRAPAPLSGFDEQRRRRWDADVVRAYVRPGRGARTDLPVMSADGREVAAMLVELLADHGSLVPREALRGLWVDTYPEHGVTRRVTAAVLAGRAAKQGGRARGDGRAHTAGTEVRKRVGAALRTLEKAGAIVRVGTDAVRVLDPTMLDDLASGD